MGGNILGGSQERGGGFCVSTGVPLGIILMIFVFAFGFVKDGIRW